MLDDIAKVLETLSEIEGASLDFSNEKKTIYVQYSTVRSLDFKFIWSENHFIGYFIDRDGELSQAVISLWSPLEAVQFVASYLSFVEIRAGR